MNKAKRIARSFSSVFSLMSIADEYNKALRENPGADRKETLRLIKKQTFPKLYKRKKALEKLKTNKEEILTNNELIMKRIIQQTKELISLIDEEVKSRQKFYETHEARWQDSKKGHEYNEETDILSELLNKLNDAICGLKNI